MYYNFCVSCILLPLSPHIVIKSKSSFHASGMLLMTDIYHLHVRKFENKLKKYEKRLPQSVEHQTLNLTDM